MSGPTRWQAEDQRQAMLNYLIRRLLLVFVVIAGVMTIVFVLQRFAGDPTLLLLPSDASAEARRTLRHQLGLDRPLLVQYATYLLDVVRGDLGLSWKFNEPALGVVLQALPATLELTFSALAFGLLFAVPLGIVAAVRRNSWADTLATAVATIGQSMPVYWLGLLLILAFSARLRWLPAMGSQSVTGLVLPVATLGLDSMARITRITRSAMLDVLRQDYIRTVRAMGVKERVVLFKHALRNAAIPIVSLVGLQLGGLLGGAVIIETVFSYPGVGRIAVQAVYSRDFPVVQAAVLVVAVAFSAVNMVVDVLCAAISPLIRLR